MCTKHSALIINGKIWIDLWFNSFYRVNRDNILSSRGICKWIFTMEIAYATFSQRTYFNKPEETYKDSSQTCITKYCLLCRFTQTPLEKSVILLCGFILIYLERILRRYAVNACYSHILNLHLFIIDVKV